MNSFTGSTTFRPTRSAFSATRLPPTHRSPVRLGQVLGPSANAALTTVLDDHLISLGSDSAEVSQLRAAAHDPRAPRPDPTAFSPIGQTVWALVDDPRPGNRRAAAPSLRRRMTRRS